MRVNFWGDFLKRFPNLGEDNLGEKKKLREKEKKGRYLFTLSASVITDSGSNTQSYGSHLVAIQSTGPRGKAITLRMQNSNTANLIFWWCCQTTKLSNPESNSPFAFPIKSLKPFESLFSHYLQFKASICYSNYWHLLCVSLHQIIHCVN